MEITTKDIVAATGGKPDPVHVLFTQKGVLKKDLGDAHKGWSLICLKDSTSETSQLSLEEAFTQINKLEQEATHKVGCVILIFGRRRHGNLDVLQHEVCQHFVNIVNGLSMVRQYIYGFVNHCTKLACILYELLTNH